MATLSVIVPVLNEAGSVESTLRSLMPWRDAGTQVIVVDGGSVDGTRALAVPLADIVLAAPCGRAAQMNAGARVAAGDVLLFLHADTLLPAAGLAALRAALDPPACAWGRFDVEIDGGGPLLRVVAALMNLRSRLSGVATGDQAIFVRREAFEAVGGFPDIPLMEDIALSRALNRLSPPACLRERARTSARRWERRGVLRTVFLMWRLRLAYALGADPRHLARLYEVERTS